MNKKAIVYCHYQNNKLYNSFLFAFYALLKLKFIYLNRNSFKDYDFVFIQDADAERLIANLCKQENIDLTKINYVSKVIDLGITDTIVNKSFYMFLRFIEFANCQYDYVWIKDLDHQFDENDIEWYDEFVNSTYDFVVVPNSAYTDYINCGDFGVKTFKYRHIFTQQFSDNIKSFIHDYHNSIGYCFDLIALDTYIKKMLGKNEFWNNAIQFIISDWRLNNLVNGNANYQKNTFKLFDMKKSQLKNEALKYFDKQNKTYKLNDTDINIMLDQTYRDKQKHNMMPNPILVDLFLKTFK